MTEVVFSTSDPKHTRGKKWKKKEERWTEKEEKERARSGSCEPAKSIKVIFHLTLLNANKQRLITA